MPVFCEREKEIKSTWRICTRIKNWHNAVWKTRWHHLTYDALSHWAIANETAKKRFIFFQILQNLLKQRPTYKRSSKKKGQ